MVNQYGESWEKLNSFVHGLTDDYMPGAITAMDIQPKTNILDFDSRNGSFTLRKLAPVAESLDCKIFALEKSETHHAHAKDNHTHGRITHMKKDLLDPDLNFGDDKIHYVFAFFTLQNQPDYRACLKKMYSLLEKGGKACFFIVSRLDDSFKFMEHLNQHPEWDWHGQHLVVPDWVKTQWAGGDHTKVIKEAVTSAGFEIEKIDVVNRHNVFDSAQDCAEFLTAGGQAAINENNLKTIEHYEQIIKEYTDFLTKRDYAGPIEAGQEGFRMDFELTNIVARRP